MKTQVRMAKSNSMELPARAEIRRHPPRNQSDQQERYIDLFDFHSVFSEVFQRDGMIVAIGPPLLNLHTAVREGKFLVDGIAIPDTSVNIEEHKLISTTTIDLSAILPIQYQAELLQLRIGSHEMECHVGRDQSEYFRDKNVLLAINRNNDLEVMSDWLHINARANEIDAVLIFDNRSDRYSIQQLAETAAEAQGPKVICIVDWPHLFGPTGGPNQKWDSNFGETVFREIARRKYLSKANTVTTADIDELHLTESGEPIWKAAIRAPYGVFRYPIRNVSNRPIQEKAPGELRRFYDFNFYDHSHPLNFKYTYAPKKLDETRMLSVHYVSNTPGFDDSTKAYVRHFVGLRRDWRSGTFSYMSDPKGIGPAGEVHFDARLADVLDQESLTEAKLEQGD